MPKNGNPRHTLTPMTETHRGAGLAEPAHTPAQDPEHVDQQIVQHAQAVVVDPQEVERGDHGGSDPRDQQHAGPEAAEPDLGGEHERHAHAQHELDAHRGEREDEAVDDRALEEAVVGEADVVLEPDEHRRHAHVLAGHAEVHRVAEGVRDQRQHQHHDGRHEQEAHPVVRPEDTPERDLEPDARLDQRRLLAKLRGGSCHVTLDARPCRGSCRSPRSARAPPSAPPRARARPPPRAPPCR